MLAGDERGLRRTEIGDGGSDLGGMRRAAHADATLSHDLCQLLQDARNGRLVAGSGAALGSADNPLPLPAGYRPPPSAPHVWGDVAASDAGFSTMVACAVGGAVGSLSTVVLNTIQGVGTNLTDLFKAASAGCAAAAAGNTVELAIYKERTRIWYPLDSAGNASRDPSQWYKCIDFKAR